MTVARTLAPALAAWLCACSGDHGTAPSLLPDEPPVIDPYIQYDTLMAGDEVELTITATDDRCLHYVQVDWGDHTPLILIPVDSARFSGSFRHRVGDIDRMLVRFIATDDAGQEALAIAVLTVRNPPRITISYPDTVPVNERFDLHLDLFALFGLDRVMVDFGDGAAPNEYHTTLSYYHPTILHTYTATRSYVLTVQATDRKFQRTTETRTIEVIPWPD